MPSSAQLPRFDDVLDAAARIAAHARATPVLRADALDAQAGARLWFKAEGLQRGGAFKFRGACNAVACLSDADAARGVVTHSSGHHGAALALAARLRAIPRHVVAPDRARCCTAARRPWPRARRAAPKSRPPLAPIWSTPMPTRA